MSYHLNNGAEIPEEIRRIVLEQVSKALDGIRSGKLDRDAAIHDARVCFKKIHAVLRLVRVQMGGAFKQENSFYRELGRDLSAARNDRALLDSFDKLKEHFNSTVSAPVFQVLRGPLARANAEQRDAKERSLAKVLRALRPARSRVRKWPLRGDNFTDLGEGLRLVYRRARINFANAQSKPSVESLHECRKSTKTLWYQLRLLKPLWPKPMAKLADELETLADRLSDDRDLALLRQRAGEYADQKHKSELEALMALIDQRRAELQLEAVLLGERLYAEKPRRFADRLARYWKAWRLESESQPKEVQAALRPKRSSLAA